MSIAFNVSFNNATQKVSVNISKSIGDVATAALQKHNQLGDGEIFYNGKRIDNSTPIRFSNLFNNCKLEMKLAEIKERMINCKLQLPDNQVKVMKMSNSTRLGELVKNELQLDTSALMVNILNKTVAIEEDGDKSISGVIGNLDNVVMRFSYRKNEQEQRQVVERENRQREERRERERKEKFQEQEKAKENEVKENEAREHQTKEHQTKEHQTKEHQTKEHQTKEHQTKEQHISQEVLDNHHDQMLIDEKHDHIDIKNKEITHNEQETESIPQHTQETNYSQPPPQSQSFPENTVIYKPSSTTTYENPEEDYEFTLDHAKKYQELIRYKPTKPKAKIEKVPQKYHIRIKFPNNYLLEIKFDNTNVKFGELVKKIDDNLTEDFKSNYNLKVSYPPFKKFNISFSLNQTFLLKLPEFDTNEKVLLIWETDKTGQYLVNDQAVDFGYLPEVQLEQNRRDLPDEQNKSKKLTKDKTPKWFKMNK